eukprot:13163889-Alexandrium_andersonii.AAC.1
MQLSTNLLRLRQAPVVPQRGASTQGHRKRTPVLKPYDQLASWTPSWTVQGRTNAQTQQGAVSYTHLTLPTICSV